MADIEPEDIPLEQALETIARRLAGLTASVDGFAERQQDLLGRDYSAELAQIHETSKAMGEAIKTLSRRPAIALTAKELADQIAAAGRDIRREDHAALAAARQDMQKAAGNLATMTASARTARQQNQWLAGAVGLALVLGSFGGCSIPPAIDWMVPEAWHWPERRAISALHRDGWEAGDRLMSVADPDQWRDVQAAIHLWQANGDSIETCAKRARDRRLRSVGCLIEVRGQLAGGAIVAPSS
ncbi:MULTISPECIES: DUF6118 family protein [Sphingomonadaceae]|uniref:DUF6118 family protein n=1 Tax=Blastomonas fulva TaxID=1550728 RepID=UPI004034B533